MSSTLAITQGESHHSNHSEETPLSNQRTSTLNTILGSLTPGEITYVELPWKIMGPIVYQVVVEVLREEGINAVQVDGCNMANPYEIVKIAKRAGMNPKPLLDRVSICRDFTAYQMSTIIDDKLEHE